MSVSDAVSRMGTGGPHRGRHPHLDLRLLIKKRADRCVVWVPPADAERMAGGIGVDLVPLGCGEIVGGIQDASAQLDRFGMGRCWVVDVQINMDLLRDPVRPLRGGVVGCELDADPPVPVSIDDAMEIVVGEDSAAEHSRPKGAFGGKICGIEDDDLSNESHWVRLGRET